MVLYPSSNSWSEIYRTQDMIFHKNRERKYIHLIYYYLFNIILSLTLVLIQVSFKFIHPEQWARRLSPEIESLKELFSNCFPFDPAWSKLIQRRVSSFDLSIAQISNSDWVENSFSVELSERHLFSGDERNFIL